MLKHLYFLLRQQSQYNFTVRKFPSGKAYILNFSLHESTNLNIFCHKISIIMVILPAQIMGRQKNNKIN